MERFQAPAHDKAIPPQSLNLKFEPSLSGEGWGADPCLNLQIPEVAPRRCPVAQRADGLGSACFGDLGTRVQEF